MRDLLRLAWGVPENMLGLELAAERWGGLAGFGRAYEANEAEFEDLCIEDGAFADGVHLGFAWGMLQAVANLAGTDMGTMCQLAAEAIDAEEAQP